MIFGGNDASVDFLWEVIHHVFCQRIPFLGLRSFPNLASSDLATAPRTTLFERVDLGLRTHASQDW